MEPHIHRSERFRVQVLGPRVYAWGIGFRWDSQLFGIIPKQKHLHFLEYQETVQSNLNFQSQGSVPEAYVHEAQRSPPATCQKPA